MVTKENGSLKKQADIVCIFREKSYFPINSWILWSVLQ